MDSFVKGAGGVFALRCLLSSAWRGPAKTQDAAVHRAETEATLNNESLCLNCRSLQVRLTLSSDCYDTVLQSRVDPVGWDHSGSLISAVQAGDTMAQVQSSGLGSFPAATPRSRGRVGRHHGLAKICKLRLGRENQRAFRTRYGWCPKQ